MSTAKDGVFGETSNSALRFERARERRRNEKSNAASPHLRASATTRQIMGDVLIALLPAVAGAVYFFGWRSLSLILVSAIAALLGEWAWQKARRKPLTTDLSAVVTGVLLAMNLPATAPFYVAVIGSLFAVLIVKACFGGLGNNFMNPALAGRALLLACFAGSMTAFVLPETPFAGAASDAVSGATVLAQMRGGSYLTDGQLLDAFLGKIGGALGETSALLLLAGGAYLFWRRVISYRIPLAMLGSMALAAWLFGGHDGILSADYSVILGHLFGGSAILGALFMATDYASSPAGPMAQWIFGAGCGLLTMLFRLRGSAAEGVSYAILIMNCVAPLLDRWLRPRVLGERRKILA